MKILWITSSGWNEGGVENMLSTMKVVFEERGHTVKIFSSDARPDMEHFSDFEYKAPRGILRPFFYSCNFSAYFTLKKVLKEYNPDIIHIHTIGHASPIILFALRDSKAVLSVHGPEAFIKSLIVFCLPKSDFHGGVQAKKYLRATGLLRYVYHRYVNGILYTLGFRYISAMITPSHYMQKLVQGDGYQSVCIPNGVRLFAYAPNVQDNPPQVVLSAGRLEIYKGVDVLIRAFSTVIEQFPQAKLVIAGDGGERSNLERLAMELHIEQSVIFLGHISREVIQREYRAASVFAMPSTWVEAFGNVGIEAMSVGRPVVASDVGGISDWLIDGKTGFLVPPSDTKALAHAISELFTNTSLLKEMMKQSRARAEEFSIERHVDALITFYNTTIQRDVSSKG